MRNSYKYIIALLGAIFLSACILYLSDSVVWTVVIFSVLLGILSIWIPVIIPIAFIIATVIVPDEILPVLSQTSELHGFGMVKLHPASITLFIGTLINIMPGRNILIDKLKGSKSLAMILVLFALFSMSIFVQTLPLGGLKGMPQCLENYIIPFCFFLYLLTLDKKAVFLMLKCIVGVILLLAIYGLIEQWARCNFIYDKFYSMAMTRWYSSATSSAYRITTTIGHPLKNALYFLFAIPVSVFVFRKPYNIISAIILLLAVFATGSRAGLLISGLIIIACFVKTGFNLFEHYKSILIAATVALVFYVALYHSHLGDTLMHRFYADRGSTTIRLYAMRSASAIMKSNLLTGKGMGLSYEYSSSLLRTEETGFENPWLMLIADVGVLTTLCYAAILLLPIIARIRNLKYGGMDRAIYLSLIAFLLMTYSYDSFGSRTAINFLLWFNIALLYADVPRRKEA